MGKVHEIVTNRILSALEAGTVPWRRPWDVRYSVPFNWASKRPYRGVNRILLEPGEYATFRQIIRAGGKVKRGAKARLVVFWKPVQVSEQTEDGEVKIKEVPVLRYYQVFNVVTDCEGLESRIPPRYHHDPIQRAEEIVAGYKDAPVIRESTEARACYVPAMDMVAVPPMSDFATVEGYYSTLFHELVHSTGHPKRLGRFGAADDYHAAYAKEELVAEIGAAMLCWEAGISPATLLDNQAAYVQGWLNTLNNDKRLVVIAASQAQKAVDLILGCLTAEAVTQAEAEEEEEE